MRRFNRADNGNRYAWKFHFFAGVPNMDFVAYRPEHFSGDFMILVPRE